MMEVIPTGAALGAEVRGVDLSRPLDAATVSAVMEAWRAHLVLLFRHQDIDDAALIAFSRHFGELDLCPPNSLGRRHSDEHPELTIVSNVKVNGVPIGALGNGEVRWHTDMSNHPVPPSASILRAVEVPPSGGETGFINMYAVTDDLPADLRTAAVGRRAYQDGTYDSSGAPHKAVDHKAGRVDPPSAQHPLMRRHPVTGREVLYLGRRPNQYIVGIDRGESDRLVDALWAHATQEKYAWHHRWDVGDVIVWDNRCVMHRRNPFSDDGRRILHRTQVRGEAVIAA
jgi:taurine dioxygenase